MSLPLPGADPRQSSAARRYQLMALLALLLVFVVMLESGLEVLSLVVLLLGALAIGFHWTIGPPLLLVLLTLLLTDWRELVRRLNRLIHLSRPGGLRWGAGDVLPLTELVLAVAVLAFVIAQYRLVSLTRHIFPMDPRRPVPGPAPPPRPRHPDLVGEQELAYTAVALPGWAAAGFLVWSLLSFYPVSWFGLPPDTWRILLVAWVAGLGLIVTRAVVGYLVLTRATEAEARLYLQDQLWRETRREQARIETWTTRARLRAQRRKEGT
jgi:hypothetical protein